MPESTSVSYVCQICSYPNSWTRDEVLQRGEKLIYKDPVPTEDFFSLPCKNLTVRPRCTGRYIIAVKREG